MVTVKVEAGVHFTLAGRRYLITVATMAAYLLVIRRRVIDADRYAEYLVAANETLRDAGATVLAAGGAVESWEGPSVDGAVVVEFRDLEHARAWFESSRYVEIRALREGAADLEIVVTESVNLPTSVPASQPGGDKR